MHIQLLVSNFNEHDNKIAHTFVTPIIMLVMWLHTVLMHANSLLEANHRSIRSFFELRRVNSKRMWLKLRTRVPRGPLTVISRPFVFTSTACQTNKQQQEPSKSEKICHFPIFCGTTTHTYHCQRGPRPCWREWSS